LDELFKKLSRSAFLNSEVGYKVPVLIFMSDGGPTDDYKSALRKITNNNKWFKASTKICLAIDDESDVEVLQEIAGCGDKNKGIESVIQVSDMETLKKLIKVVSVTATMIGAKSRTDADTTHDTISAIRGEMEGVGDVVISDPDPVSDYDHTPDPEPEDTDPWGTGDDWE
jgi:uncharacterized protein YegL